MARPARRRTSGAPTARQALALRELNRATLARQLLLEPGGGGVPATVRTLAALQSQHPDWPAVALWSRLRRFEALALERAFRDRRVVRASLMRITLHVVAATDFWPMWRVTGGFRRSQWRLMYRRDPADPALLRDLAPAHDAVVEALGERPRTREAQAEELIRFLEPQAAAHRVMWERP